MTSIIARRPRDVNILQAASILYGDWGTSKAYVIGLAFALASYSSFWLVALLGIMNILIALNYIIVCRVFPNGGGVYASVVRRSEVLALMAAFFLIADYLVTASLSAVSGFSYLGVAHPTLWAMGAIMVIGLLNYFGPRHTGNLAFLIAFPTFLVVVALAVISLPFLGEAVQRLEPLHDSPKLNWIHFVSIIVGMSGIEAIANTTGVMRLDTEERPYSVVKTSTPAILTIMLEVSIFTTLFALAANALPGLVISDGEVNAPGNPGVRDYMLRYMGEVFAGRLFGEPFGSLFGFIISVVFCVLLLSAVNTAIIALVSLLFVMSRNRNIPRRLQRLNNFGVPLIPLVFATIAPMMLVAFYKDVAALADLYAVGFVGAIATNLGSTSTDKSLKLSKVERVFMFSTFLTMAAIEITLLIQKPHARNFALAIMLVGLLLRSLVIERKEKEKFAKAHPKPSPKKPIEVLQEDQLKQAPAKAVLCAAAEPNKALTYALNEGIRTKNDLYVLFVRQQQVITEEDHARTWLEDNDAISLYNFTSTHSDSNPVHFLYVISESPSATIAEIAKTLRVSQIVLHQRRTVRLQDFLRGNVIYQVGKNLPKDIDLVVIV